MNEALLQLAEARAIARLAARFPRRADQWNRPHEADAELVPLGPDLYLASTIDGLANEVSSGFYRDAYTAGWVLVQANLSDLAAVGAAPLGVLLALSLPPGYADAERLSDGIADSLEASGVASLGGDLNESAAVSLTGCALGLVSGRPLGRVGIRPGDEIWATGPLGGGNALAITHLLGLPEVIAPESRYRPLARLEAGVRLRAYAHALMDTSDGPMSTLDHLARLNGVGFRIAFDPDRLVAPEALGGFRQAGLPGWPLLCGEHGEYELLVAIAPADAARLQTDVPEAHRVAIATESPGLLLSLPDAREVAYDGAFIRNLADRAAGDWRTYAHEFQAYGTALGLP